MVSSIALLLGVATIAGAACTWLALRVRVAERRGARLDDELQALCETTGALACVQEAAEACTVSAQAAVRLFNANRALVLLEDANGTLHPTGEANWQASSVTAALEQEGMEAVREQLRRPDGIPLDPASLERLAGTL